MYLNGGSWFLWACCPIVALNGLVLLWNISWYPLSDAGYWKQMDHLSMSLAIILFPNLNSVQNSVLQQPASEWCVRATWEGYVKNTLNSSCCFLSVYSCPSEDISCRLLSYFSSPLLCFRFLYLPMWISGMKKGFSKVDLGKGGQQWNATDEESKSIAWVLEDKITDDTVLAKTSGEHWQEWIKMVRMDSKDVSLLSKEI